MQFEQIIMLVILAVITFGTSLIVVRRNKNSEGSNNLNILLLEYLSDIMELAKSALSVLETNRDSFNSDREFYDALSNIVMRDLRVFLQDKADVNPKILDLLTEENLSEIVYVTMSQIKKYVENRNLKRESYMEQTEEIYTEELPTVIENTVDITSELNKILENADSIDPWNSNDYE